MIGQTKDTGFVVGVRKTFPISHEKAWELICSKPVLDIWVGKTGQIKLEKGAKYLTEEGITGEVRVVNPGGNIRLTWQPPGWEIASTIQVRTLPNSAKTTISFHQENLAGPHEREEMRVRWEKVLEELEKLITR
jgi:uncharacterized protein YndB with AHSA1/START domain